jgi:hypothetical protein
LKHGLSPDGLRARSALCRRRRRAGRNLQDRVLAPTELRGARDVIRCAEAPSRGRAPLRSTSCFSRRSSACYPSTIQNATRKNAAITVASIDGETISIGWQPNGSNYDVDRIGPGQRHQDEGDGVRRTIWTRGPDTQARFLCHRSARAAARRCARGSASETDPSRRPRPAGVEQYACPSVRARVSLSYRS